jgi:hypothetical protein
MKRLARTAARLGVGLSLALAVGTGVGVTTSVTSAPTAARADSTATDDYVTAAEVVARARYWLDKGIPYSKSASYPDAAGRNYRTDCSGYVSMAWHLGTSRVTFGDASQNLAGVASALSSKDQLQRGDLMMAPGENGHAVLFEQWTNSSHTSYLGYEFGSTPVTYRVIPYPYDPSDPRTFSPYHYTKLLRGGDRPAEATYFGVPHVFTTDDNGATVHKYYDGTSWQTENLGGFLVGPLTAAEFNGSLFVIGANQGTVYAKSYNGVAWTNWTAISTGFDPSATVYANQLHVVSRAADNTIVHAWMGTNGPWSTENLGGISQPSGQSPDTVDSPTSTVFNGAYYIAISAWGTVYLKYYGSSSWHNWSAIPGAGGAGYEPQITTFSNHLDVVSRGSDGHVEHAWITTKTWSSESLGGTITSAPAVTVYNGGLYVSGSNQGSLYERHDTGSWSAWAKIDNANRPSAIVYQDGSATNLHLFSRGNGNEITTETWNGSTWTTGSMFNG